MTSFLKLYSFHPSNLLFPLKKAGLTLCLLASTQVAFSQWNKMETGITGNLKAIFMTNQNQGMMVGDQGIFYTTTGTAGASNWNKWVATDSTIDALLNRSVFKDCVGYGTSQEFNVIGHDTVNNRSFVLYIELSSVYTDILYTGAIGTTLNSIHFSTQGQLYAAGDNGLLLYASNRFNFTPLATGTTRNLTSLAGQSFGSMLAGGDEILVSHDYTNTSNPLNKYNSPGNYFTDIHCSLLSSNMRGVGSTDYSGSLNQVSPYTNYDFGPLNASALSYVYNHGFFVATDHGIYTSGITQSPLLEFQPGTEIYSLNDIFFTNNVGYSVGTNGVLLVTQNYGNSSIPFAVITSGDVCMGDYYYMRGESASGKNCQWLIDGTPYSTDCIPVILFPNPGSKTLTYIVTTDGGLTDTATKTINVLNGPDVNLPVLISDSILCKSEQILVTIDNTQNGVFYTLHRLLNDSLGAVAGNGGQVQFSTAYIDTSANYYLTASYDQIKCSRKFTDQISIRVEQTRAVPSFNLINAGLNEKVDFYSASIDAQHSNWYFSNLNPSITESTDKNPIGVSFGNTGLSKIQLAVWSDNGCYDSLSTDGPGIIVETDGTCKFVETIGGGHMSGTEPEQYRTRKMSMTLVNGSDPLIVGTTSTSIYDTLGFGSRIGAIRKLPPGWYGGYVARYSNNGTLRWMGQVTEYSDYDPTQPDDPAIMNCVGALPSGKVMISGNLPHKNTSYYYSQSTGDSILITTTAANYESSYILKLNEFGQFVDKALLTNILIQSMTTDDSGNVYVAGYGYGGFTHGIDTVPIPHTYAEPGTYYSHVILKLDSNLNMVWKTYLKADQGIVNNFEIDREGNLFILGSHTGILSYGSTDNTNHFAESGFFEGHTTYIGKYNSSGIFQWHANIKTINGPNSFGCSPVELKLDEAGNSYVSCDIWEGDMAIKDATGAVSIIANLGSSGLVKFSPDGKKLWALKENNSPFSLEVANGKVYQGLTSRIEDYQGEIYGADTTQHMKVYAAWGSFYIVCRDTAGNLEWYNASSIIHQPSNISYLIPQFIRTDGNGNNFVYATGYVSYKFDFFGNALDLDLGNALLLKMDSAGCSNVSYLGLSEPTQEGSSLTIFPNPASTHLDVFPSFGFGSGTINILDISGRTLYSGHLPNENKVQLNGHQLPQLPGIYLVKLISSNGKMSIGKFEILK